MFDVYSTNCVADLDGMRTFCAVAVKPLMRHNLCMAKVTDTTVTRTIRNKEETASRLVAAREHKGWSRPDLVKNSGRSVSEIAQFERADRPVTIEAAAVFQELFDLPAAWFLGLIDSREHLAVYCALEGFKGDPGRQRGGDQHQVVSQRRLQRSKKDVG